MAGILLEGENVSDEERAAHARTMSERNREEAIQRMAEARARIGDARLKAAETVDGTIIGDHLVAAGAPFSLTVRAGNRLRIIDLEGRQAVDFLCYDAANHENRYNAGNTIKFNRSIYIGSGFRLYSDLGDILMTIEADTIGWHDTIAGCCSTEANYLRYGVKDTPSCRRNFISELSKYGMGPRDIPANLNFFAYAPVELDGTTAFADGKSQPGDYIDLSAQRDVLVVISNCPQVFNPCNGWNPTPIRVIEWKSSTV
jgi:uncharacterized protein